MLVRLAKKASFYGQELDGAGNPIGADKADLKIDVDEVVKLYKDYIIPLTKVVEVSVCGTWPVGSRTYFRAKKDITTGRIPPDTIRWAIGGGDQDFASRCMSSKDWFRTCCIRGVVPRIQSKYVLFVPLSISERSRP